MNRHSPKISGLLVGQLALSIIASLLGLYFLVLAFAVILPVYDDYWLAPLCGSVGLGLVLLLAGLRGLRACIRRIRGRVETTDLPPP